MRRLGLLPLDATAAVKMGSAAPVGMGGVDLFGGWGLAVGGPGGAEESFDQAAFAGPGGQ